MLVFLRSYFLLATVVVGAAACSGDKTGALLVADDVGDIIWRVSTAVR